MPGDLQPPPPKPISPAERPLDLVRLIVVLCGAALALGSVTGVWVPAYLVALLASVVLFQATLDHILDWIPAFWEKFRRMLRWR